MSTPPPTKNKQVNLRRVKARGLPDEFYVYSTINTLAVRPGEYLSEQRVEGLIVLDPEIDIRIEPARPNRHWRPR